MTPAESAEVPAEPPARVRITAQSALEDARRPDPVVVDARSAFFQSLMRSQLRLALACLTGFLGLLTLFVLALNYFPELRSVRLFQVPLASVLLGFGVYPLIITTALIYARAARRNEASYRDLIRLEHPEE
ncbi:MAG: DUF485 domain-containing protein [Agromyces sp.]